ncbi:MAG: hypothetical protein HYT12_00695 [Candidatus Liptonbacteria bacterium]|nr:hypothetical protein [Candidatus Liptonbacteria bacterium]
MKKIKNNKKKNSSTHNFGVIVEHFESKLDLVVEGNQMLDQKIETLRGDINERFQVVDQKFDAVFDELHLIRNDLKEKVSRDEFVVLEKRVLALEKKANQK